MGREIFPQRDARKAPLDPLIEINRTIMQGLQAGLTKQLSGIAIEPAPAFGAGFLLPVSGTAKAACPAIHA